MVVQTTMNLKYQANQNCSLHNSTSENIHKFKPCLKYNNNNNNNDKNGAYKALTTEVSKRYNKQNTMINNYILNKTKNYK